VGKLGLIAYAFAIVLYALIGLLAIAPRIVGNLGLDATPVRVEAVLLTVLVFAGVNVAWLLLFEDAPAGHASAQQAIPSQQASPLHDSGATHGHPGAEGGHASQAPE
jgi:hypothetical protein